MTSIGKCVLIAEDNASVRSIVVDVLRSEGYRTVEAESGGQALKLAMENDIDAFLLDVQMPGGNGIDLCRNLRALEKYSVTPIIFLTASPEFEAMAEAFDAGCDDFINKPMNPIVLRARLKGHIQRTEYFQQLERTRNLLNRYLSRRTLEVVEAASKTGIAPPPQERDLAILFTDLRGFTELSGEIEPGRLFDLVSSLLAYQVDIVHAHGGYVDKFGGDGVMAIFDGPDMIVQSCLCAINVVSHPHKDAQALWHSGIGIHTGRAIIGNIGSPQHLDYSVIGTAVNMAARLCGHAEPASIVVSEQVRTGAADDFRLCFHSERNVAIKGIKEPVTVYTLSPPPSGRGLI